MTECTLCGLPAPDPPVTDSGIPGAYCCRGCLEVRRTLGDVDDGDQHRDRHQDQNSDQAQDPGQDQPQDHHQELARDPTAALATGPDEIGAEGETVTLAVDGMHCATCEAFLEARATDADGVLAARASYPAGVVRLSYDPDRLDRGALPSLLNGTGYAAREVDEPARADDPVGRLLVGGFFGMMTMLWYVLFLYPTYLGADPALLLLDVTGPAGWYLLGTIGVMAAVVVGYAGAPILRGAYVSLRAGRPNMDLLVALAATTAYAYSVVALALGRTEVYFDVAIVIVLAVSLGNYYEDRIRRRAAGRLADLAEERADQARRRTDGGTEVVPIDDLAPDDRVVVRSGERAPVDGTVVEGTGAVDESLLTGESTPVRKRPGDEVIGGSLVAEGGLVVAVAEEATSTIDRLVDLLWRVRSARPGAQRLADRLAAVFVPLVIALAVAAFGLHVLGPGTPTEALLSGLAVLVVSCPCALGLATPLAIAAGVDRGLAAGIVMANAEAVERAPAADVIAFDKTGTLTTGALRVVEVAGGDDLLDLAAAVERFSDHPVARAIAAAAEDADRPVRDVQTHPGRGVTGTVAGERVIVGRAELFEEAGWAVPAHHRERAAAAREAGRIPALVGRAGAVRGVIVAGDQPREGWADVVSDLAADRRVVVLTGDAGAAADAFREHPGVERVYSGVPPAGKTEVIERLRAAGTVAMVGDGSNDAPALAAADLGIALGGGTALAADAADAVITTDDLAAVPRVFSLTRGVHRRIRENLAWAFCYNAVAIPLAIAGLINPLFAALAMAGSSLLVVVNSARSL